VPCKQERQDKTITRQNKGFARRSNAVVREEDAKTRQRQKRQDYPKTKDSQDKIIGREDHGFVGRSNAFPGRTIVRHKAETTRTQIYDKSNGGQDQNQDQTMRQDDTRQD
jgi:hypothetical protein